MSREWLRATVIRPPSLRSGFRPCFARCLLISVSTFCSGLVCVERGTAASATGTAASASTSTRAQRWRRRSTHLGSALGWAAAVPRWRGLPALERGIRARPVGWAAHGEVTCLVKTDRPQSGYGSGVEVGPAVIPLVTALVAAALAARVGGSAVRRFRPAKALWAI